MSVNRDIIVCWKCRHWQTSAVITINQSLVCILTCLWVVEVKLWQRFSSALRHLLSPLLLSRLTGFSNVGCVFAGIIACTHSYQLWLTLYGHIKTAEHQYGDWYTGRWWMSCYIWYSKEGSGRAAAPPSPILAVPNVTAHPSTASAPTLYYSVWHYNCLCSQSKGLISWMMFVGRRWGAVCQCEDSCEGARRRLVERCWWSY